MNILYEIITLGLIYITGDFLSHFIPVPGSLIGMILFFILLFTGILKEDRYKSISKIILANMAFFFLPPSLQVLESMDVISGNVLKLVSVLVISNILVMGVTGRVVQMLIKKEESHD